MPGLYHWCCCGAGPAYCLAWHRTAEDDICIAEHISADPVSGAASYWRFEFIDDLAGLFQPIVRYAPNGRPAVAVQLLAGGIVASERYYYQVGDYGDGYTGETVVTHGGVVGFAGHDLAFGNDGFPRIACDYYVGGGNKAAVYKRAGTWAQEYSGGTQMWPNDQIVDNRFVLTDANVPGFFLYDDAGVLQRYTGGAWVLKTWTPSPASAVFGHCSIQATSDTVYKFAAFKRVGAANTEECILLTYDATADTWTEDHVEVGAYGNTAYTCSAIVSAAGTAHVIYRSLAATAVRYAYNDGSWHNETLMSGAPGGATIGISSTGQIIMAWGINTAPGVVIHTATGSAGSWTQTNVSEDASAGYYGDQLQVSLAIPGGLSRHHLS